MSYPKPKLSQEFIDARNRAEEIYQRVTEPPEYCGVYWIITTCLTGIALGIGFGGLLWLVPGLLLPLSIPVVLFVVYLLLRELA